MNSNRGVRAVGGLLKPIKTYKTSQYPFTTRLHPIPKRTYAILSSTDLNTLTTPIPPLTPSQSQHIAEKSPAATVQTSTNLSSKKRKKPSAPLKPYRIQSGILLSRPPLLTRTPHPFETSFFQYQKRLNERLALPFTRYFYFKKDTPADNDYKLKARARNGVAARDIGGYAAYSAEGWNDELLTSQAAIATRESAVEELMKESILRINEDGSVRVLAEGEEEAMLNEMRPLPRTTKADAANNRKRLDRALDRTLYLIVKIGNKWELPSGDIRGRESLAQAAERIMVQAAGANMNTWIAGHVPIGHRIVEPEYEKTTTEATSQASGDVTPLIPEAAVTKQGTKTFFMKGRIMAGQAQIPEENPFGYASFQWATREEVMKLVGPIYWRTIQGMFTVK